MSENCTHHCESCSENCNSRTQAPQKLAPNKSSRVNRVIGVVSGKGGVGKSLVTGLLACEMARRGFKCGILDGDITGPSIPKMFGIRSRALGDEMGIYPVTSEKGMQVMSVNVLLEDVTEPVIWRGALITGTVQQFWTDVVWDADYLFIDMPPGTGDVTLTVFQSLPLDGIVIVSSPQELVQLIVGKAVKMAQKMNVPILGLVENMSFLRCPDCGKTVEIFGPSQAEKMGKGFHISPVVRLPIDPQAAQAADRGQIENYRAPQLDLLADALKKLQVTNELVEK